MCLNTSYIFASKKINKKIIEIIVSEIEPKIICRADSVKIFFSINGNVNNPINDKSGNLKNNHMKI